MRVYQGTGKVTINDRDIDNYFGLETLKLIVRSPLVLLGLEGKYDVVVRVSGGGVSGQAGAIRHGLSRALLQQSDENRAVLKKAGFLTRDPRMKERKSTVEGCVVLPSSASADFTVLRLLRLCFGRAVLLAGVSQRTGEHDCAYQQLPRRRAGCAFE